jgi:peroxiredoxin
VTTSGYEISKTRMRLLVLLIITMAVLNTVLIIQNRTLKASTRPAGGSRSISLNPGKVLPPLMGMDVDGKQLAFNYKSDQRKTVLLVFSPHCPYCRANMPNWKTITQTLDAKSFRVVGVSILSEGVKEYVDKYEFTNLPIIADPDPQNRVAYEMNLTPQTILIGPDGKVENVWTGLIQGKEREEIEQSLGVKLTASS